MEHSFFHKLSDILWGAIVSSIVVLAVYVSAGRFLMSNIGEYDSAIVAELNSRSPFVIEAQQVSGQWHSFTPEIVLGGLRLTVPGSEERPLELTQGKLAVDVWESLRTLSLRIYRINLDQLQLTGQLSEDGKLLIAGMSGGEGDFGEMLEELLLNIEQIRLSNNQLLLELPDGAERLFDLDLTLSRQGGYRDIQGTLESSTTGTQISVLGRGYGNPMDPDKFSGELYLDIINSNLRDIKPFLPSDMNWSVGGEVALEAWLTWGRGEQSAQMQITGLNLEVSRIDDSLKVPLDLVSLKASLQQRDERWSLFGSELEVHNDGVVVTLPRIQLEGRGDSMSLRLEAVDLAQLNALAMTLDSTPEKLSDVLQELQPGGELEALQLNIADYRSPMSDWDLSGNFHDLQVTSWRGAPGLESATGYVELESRGGYVILDSQDFSMAFPAIYREPLEYDEFFGTININWSKDAIGLSSGLVRARGEEGDATALFGLHIPLKKTETGLEMELMVGLKSAHPIHRTKYLPYTLNDSLLGWLKGSIGEGEIEQGAFLWRGSLSKDAPQHRTVQLFFNVTDTELDYYSGWPSVTDLEGIVFIDDSNVSVWSEHAMLYDSKLDYLSAEAWLDDSKQMQLALSASMAGNARDGLQIINQSPISEIVGDAFSKWSLEGELETSLQLQLNLTDSASAPLVDVKANLDSVSLSIDPGALTINELEGAISYGSDFGLLAPDLTGKLWGQAVSAKVLQYTPSLTAAGEGESEKASAAYDPGVSVTRVLIDTEIELEDVGQWLDLELLSLASGTSSANIVVDVPPKGVPGLTVTSDLQGVSLDLPEPWRKPAEATAQLRVDYPLAGEASVVNLSLDDTLFLEVLLTRRQLDGIALGLNQPPVRLSSGAVRISGHTPALDVDEWQLFLQNYVYGEFQEAVDLSVDGETSQQQAQELPGATNPVSSFDIIVDQLRADTFRFDGQEFEQLVLSAEKTAEGIHVEAESDWLGGQWFSGPDGGVSKLSLSHLDLSGLSDLELASSPSQEWDIPDLDVTISGLGYEGKALGNLAFELRQQETVLRVENIQGQVAGFTLTAENPGSLFWSQDTSGSHTQFKAQPEFVDLGQSLEQLTYQSIIETSAGSLDLDLRWPGGPQEFSLATVEGALNLAIEEGRFLNTPPAASGTLRVVGILNLANIVQRLSLDLSDVFSSGIPFHSIDGEVFFHGGSIEVVRMDVEGRSSGFQFVGTSQVESQSLEGELIATLPVANNLPWVAALAAGLPVAAGVFVVSKVFEKQMNRFSSAVYSLDGTWQDPQVKFSRIFDTSSGKKVLQPRGLSAEAESGDSQLPDLAESTVTEVGGTADASSSQEAKVEPVLENPAGGVDSGSIASDPNSETTTQ